MDNNRYFAILEVSPDCTYDEAKESYRTLIQFFHPDRYSHSEKLQAKATEKLKEINDAWNKVEDHFKNGAHKKNATNKNRNSSQCKIIIVECPRCSCKNRVPDRQYYHAKCGKCGCAIHSSKHTADNSQEQENQTSIIDEVFNMFNDIKDGWQRGRLKAEQALEKERLKTKLRNEQYNKVATYAKQNDGFVFCPKCRRETMMFEKMIITGKCRCCGHVFISN